LAELSLFASPLHPPIAHYKLKKVCKTEMLRKLKQRFGGKTIRNVRFRMIFLKLSLVAVTCSTVGKSIKRSISLAAQIMPKNFHRWIKRWIKGFMFERA